MSFREKKMKELLIIEERVVECSTIRTTDRKQHSPWLCSEVVVGSSRCERESARLTDRRVRYFRE
jgi:hypothetical protein